MVSVNLQTGSASGLTLAADAFSRITKVVGSASTDTLIGPLPSFDQTAWEVTGTNAGTVDGTAFESFENLTGQNATNDAFIVSGSVGGTVTGGTGGRDGLARLDGAGNLTVLQPAAADAAGTYSGVNYVGMDPYDPRSGDDAHRVITGTLFDRDMVVAPAGAGLAVSFDRLAFSAGPSSFAFAIPTGSLTLDTGTGDEDARSFHLARISSESRIPSPEVGLSPPAWYTLCQPCSRRNRHAPPELLRGGSS